MPKRARPERVGPKRVGERGAALLTVLLLVAVISVLAASALGKLRVSTRLAANSAAIEQARAYAYAAEALAVVRVNTLLNRDAARTTLAGNWSGHPYALPVPDGLATLTVTDGGNCYNLNGLVSEMQPGIYVAQKAQEDQFVRLMKLIGISGQQASSIADATADWIDTNTTPEPLGAEDSAYLGKDIPYRTANTLMTDASEIRSVAGVTPEIYAKLRRWICTLPVAEPSRININTLEPEQAPLFAMLFPDTMDAGKARGLLLQRPAQGYSSTSDFWNLATRGGDVPSASEQSQAGVRTYWFKLAIDVQLAGAELTQTALLDASGQTAQIVSREWGDPE